MKKILSKVLSIILCFTIIAGILPTLKINTKAASADYSDIYKSELTFMSDKMAQAFIGFIYNVNTSKVSDEMKSMDNIFNYLTGRLTKGSDEYIYAQTAFLLTQSSFINRNLNTADKVTGIASNNLINLLMEKSGSNPDVAANLANSFLGDVKSRLKKILLYVTEFDETLFYQNFEMVMSTYSSYTSVKGKVEDFIFAVDSFVNASFLLTNHNAKQSYEYYSVYLNNRKHGEEILELLLDTFILGSSGFYDGMINILDFIGLGNSWSNEDVQRLLRTFAEFTYHSQLEMEKRGGSGSSSGSSGSEGGSGTSSPIAISTVKFMHSSYNISSNMWVEIPVYKYPYNATVGTSISYSSSNTSVATVNSRGRITAVAPGTAYIYATSSNGVKAECKITVLPYYVEEVTGGYSIYHYLGKNLSVNIPEKIAETNIVEIGSKAFYENKTFTSVTIPGTVKTIGEQAFYGCTGLNEVSIPNSVTTIETSAFNGCSSLNSIAIPSSVKSIGTDAFYFCKSLKKVNITSLAAWSNISFETRYSNPLTYAGKLYLNGSIVTNLSIPSGVTAIKDYAFFNCTSITSVSIPNTVTSIGLCAFSGCPFLKTVSMANSVKTLGTSAFQECSSLVKTTLSSNLTEIPGYAFYKCTALETAILPESLKTIGKYSFYECDGITTLTLPSKVETIESYAFAFCDKLSYLTIPSTIKTLGTGVFSECIALKKVEIDEGMTYIPQDMFSGCKSLKEITIPNGITTIGHGAFEKCSSLKEITLPKSVSQIAGVNSTYGVFNECNSLENIYVDANNSAYSSLNGVLFDKEKTEIICYPANKTLTKYNIPNGVLVIGTGAFKNCKNLVEINIPNTVTTLEENTFKNCASLKSIFIPESINSLVNSGSQFAGCTSLEEIRVAENSARFTSDNGVFYNATKSWPMIHKYPAQRKGETYFIRDDVRTISTYAFSHCEYLENVVIPERVTAITGWVFYNCNSLKTITITKNIQSISAYAFYNCNNLTTIYYEGSKEDWENITIHYPNTNTPLLNANIIYNHTHNYKTKITEHTCFEKGYTTYTCECGFNFDSDYVDASHFYADKVTPPTKTEQGYVTHICSECGDTYTDGYVDYDDVITEIKAISSDVDITLLWNAYKDKTDKYYVRRYSADGSYKTYSTDNTSMTFKDLEYGEKYTFKVITKNSTGYMAWNEATPVTAEMIIGERVVGLSATIQGKGAKIDFLPVPDAEGYYAYVYEADTMTRVYTKELSADATSFVANTNLDAGKKYVVKITPKLNGKWVAGVKENGVGVEFTAPIINPTSITIADQTATSVRFNWSAVRGVDEYYIRVKEKESGEIVRTIHVTGGKTTATLSRYTDGTRISPDTTYTLEFCAYVSGASISYGEAIELTTKNFEEVNVSAKLNDEKVNLSWNSTTDSTGYYIYRIHNGKKTYIKYVEGSTSITVSAPKISGEYTYGVIAIESNTSGKAYVPMAISNSIAI